MSKEINNREYRKQVIRDLLSQLHEGKSVDEVKEQFEKAFSGVSASEISAAEQSLIESGLPVEEVQKLCDVHAAVFKGSIEEIHAQPETSDIIDYSKVEGHPINTVHLENRAIEKVIQTQIEPCLSEMQSYSLLSESSDLYKRLNKALKPLLEIDIHYIRKENLFFPYLEKYGITAPPQVMWGVDDEIRAMIKESIKKAGQKEIDVKDFLSFVNETLLKITEMIFKEENILLPMMTETLTIDEWHDIAEQSPELGYCLIDPPSVWQKTSPEKEVIEDKILTSKGEEIDFPGGFLKPDEINLILNTLPVDITFVDKDDTVKYFSQASERIFPRTRSVIGRKVINCHPPGSMHVVEQIVKDFKSGEKDSESFWINMKGQLIYIRYFAVRDENNKYIGTLEVTQNISDIQKITGEKRLLSD